MRYLSAVFQTDSGPSFWDNEVLDEWNLPVGEWVKDMVNWVAIKGETILDVVEWPFRQLLTRIVDDGLISDRVYDGTPDLLQWALWPFTFGIREVSWILVILAFVLIGTISRNFVVGLGAGFGLLVAGLLSFDLWDLTVQTIGMIVVAVIICTIVGIPLGILSARSDKVWSALRPVLDGMQVVHPFVYLLPVIFFFGVGRTPGTIATMIFALPPIVRLTNLGIRQVPADVVEAARAYGASEGRVLRDVQLPLARPAIMTGLNQTLLMALSMVGIVALIAGGGLGQPILRGVNTLNVVLSVQAGLALYLVGVVLDRISQPQAGEVRVSLWRRIVNLWVGKPDSVEAPEIDVSADKKPDTVAVAAADGADAGQAGSRSLAGGLLLVSGAVAIVGSLLDWGEESGLLSAWGRKADRDLSGQAFSGLDTAGGSWFGILTLIVGVLAALVGLRYLLGKRVSWGRLVGSEAGIAFAVTAVIIPATYLIAQPSESSAGYTDGPGPYVALLAGVGMLVGAVLGALGTRFVETHEEPRPPARLAIGVGIGVAVLVVSVFSTWIFDERSGTTQEDLAAQIQVLVDQGVTPAVAAAQVAELAGPRGAKSTDALSSDGPQFGLLVLVLAAVAAAAALYRTARTAQINERTRWLLDSGVTALGAAAIGVGAAWTLSLVRIAVPQLSPGVGAFFAMIGGLLILTSGTQYLQTVHLTPPE